MPDFLLELLSEEIPARMQARAETDLSRLFTEQLAAAGLAAEAIDTFSTPRRLALIARSLPAETKAVSEELKGPRAGAPPQALEGFLRKTGVAREQLVERDGVLFAIIEKPGGSTASVLAQAIPAIIRAFPWPRSMRWGEASTSTESLRWVRPLQGIVALLGNVVVECGVAAVKSGAATLGHRFHHPGIITIGSAGDYAEKLRACHVIVDPAERRRIIAEGARAAAAAAGLALVEDEGLVAENAGLTEWPVPLLGGFDPAFLDLPREVIELTMRTNQKYFACTRPDGSLAANFVCTANIEASDGGAAIVAGNERVLSARLSDARFFWEQDLKIPLDEQAKKLSQIVFHEKLGTVADKVERVARLARWLVESDVIREKDGMTKERLADLAERAARLAKADLVTGMVGEFPELQGVIGGYLARAQGEPDEVANAIRDHYKPAGQGDQVPTAPVTVAVGLAERWDALVQFFAIDEKPTGSRDPFALRRAALGFIGLVVENNLRFELEAIFRRYIDLAALDYLGLANTLESLRYFLAERLKVEQREAGVRHDLIDAVFGLGGENDLVRLLARVRALQTFVETPEGADLLAGYKRAANILKKEGWEAGGRGLSSHEEQGIPQTGEEDPFVLVEEPAIAEAMAELAHPEPSKRLSYVPLPEEAALIAALDAAEPKARSAIEAEDFEGAMAALAGLRAPVDSFFDKVTVNDPDPAKREARLDLLARMRDAFQRVADFSRIEG